MNVKPEKDKRLYNIWSCMRQRCNNPKHTAAPWYHDKGIRVCPEWEHDFEEKADSTDNQGCITENKKKQEDKT